MKTYIFVLLLFTGALFGQEFRPYHAIADSLLVKTVVGKKSSYSYQSYLFEIMGRQLKMKESKKLIFSDEAVEGARKIIPYLFVSENPADHLILMTEQSSEIINGFNLYVLKGLDTKLMGFFALALNTGISKTNKMSPPSPSLVDYINIETNGTQWRITFTADELVIHPGTDREETMSGKEIKFLYNGKKLKEVDEF